MIRCEQWGKGQDPEWLLGSSLNYWMDSGAICWEVGSHMFLQSILGWESPFMPTHPSSCSDTLLFLLDLANSFFFKTSAQELPVHKPYLPFYPEIHWVGVSPLLLPWCSVFTFVHSDQCLLTAGFMSVSSLRLWEQTLCLTYHHLSGPSAVFACGPQRMLKSNGAPLQVLVVAITPPSCHTAMASFRDFSHVYLCYAF